MKELIVFLAFLGVVAAVILLVEIWPWRRDSGGDE